MRPLELSQKLFCYGLSWRDVVPTRRSHPSPRTRIAFEVEPGAEVSATAAKRISRRHGEIIVDDVEHALQQKLAQIGGLKTGCTGCWAIMATEMPETAIIVQTLPVTIHHERVSGGDLARASRSAYSTAGEQYHAGGL